MNKQDLEQPAIRTEFWLFFVAATMHPMKGWALFFAVMAAWWFIGSAVDRWRSKV